MPDRNGLVTEIGRLFAERLHLDVPAAGTDLFETGALDSMSFVDLLAQLERRFGVRFALEALDLEGFRTIAGIAGVIEAHRRHAAAREGEGA
jgi:acyl carrier protein